MWLYSFHNSSTIIVHAVSSLNTIKDVAVSILLAEEYDFSAAVWFVINRKCTLFPKRMLTATPYDYGLT